MNVCSAVTESAELLVPSTPNLHRGEVSLPVEHKLHLHVFQRVVLPAQVVVSRPHALPGRLHAGLCEVVLADHAVRQLTQAAREPPAG